MDQFLRAAIEEAELGLAEGGIPIGSVVVHHGRILGRGRNRRVQRGSVVLHGEMDALEKAGRQSAHVYRECTLYTTLSPCAMRSGAILLYGIPRVVVGENRTFLGEEDLLRARGVVVEVLQDPRCQDLMARFSGSSRPNRPCGRRTSGSEHVRWRVPPPPRVSADWMAEGGIPPSATPRLSLRPCRLSSCDASAAAPPACRQLPSSLR